jgi:predicted metal-binding membrane protein
MASSPDRTIRTGLLTAIVLLTGATWLLTSYQVRDMGPLMRIGVPMSLTMPGSLSIASFTTFTAMWLIMMIAMMLPSTYPTLLLVEAISRKRSSNSSAAFVFSAAYFIAWTASGVLFYVGYLLIGAFQERVSTETLMRTAGAAVALAGLYQWSPLKLSCLRHCRNPFDFLSRRWRDGRLGAFLMGIEHGGYCMGCCWGLMLVLFVMGSMNLAWMAGIGAIILLEKLIPSQKWFPAALGGLFTITGILIAVFPALLSALS